LLGLALPGRTQELEELRGQLQELRREVQSLREELRQVRSELASATPASSGAPATPAAPAELVALAPPTTPAALASSATPAAPAAPDADAVEEQHLIAAKVAEQHQTKVDSGSKYQVRLSGMALLSGFYTRGWVDDIDVAHTASAALPGEPAGSFAATVRQSLVRLDVSGPRWRGAKASGDLQFDFFGGFPGSPEGVTAGLLRLRTANLRLDWPGTSVVAGQDAPFISPLSPTSLATTAYPALSAAGNLWTWTPQIYIDRKLYRSGAWKISMQGGVLDALTGELPVTEYDRTPTSGENGRMPAYATRLSFQRAVDDRSAAWGIGGYYARQNWNFNRTVDSWLVTSDWDIPLGRYVAISGELYRGRAIGGLGGGATGSVVLSGSFDSPATRVMPFDSTGGWSQLKFKPMERMQFNAAFGKDASSITRLAEVSGLIHRNAAGMANVIYQPRSNLLFSIEYRRLWTSRYDRLLTTADQIGWGAGILF
jgi:hypothetical protein